MKREEKGEGLGLLGAVLFFFQERKEMIKKDFKIKPSRGFEH